FALVGDADRRDVIRRDVGARHRGARRRNRCGPDALRVVLDPARRWKDLRKLELRESDRAERCVEQKRARRGGPLIDREQMTHAASGPGKLSTAARPPPFSMKRVNAATASIP